MVTATKVAAAGGGKQKKITTDPDEGVLTKRQIRDNPPKRIKRLQFGLSSGNEIVKQGVVEVSDRNVYDLTSSRGSHRVSTRHGPLDLRMGISNGNDLCATCGLGLKNCNGHFGYVKLALPAFHIGFMKKIIEILHCICKECGNVMLDDKSKRAFLKSLRRLALDGMEQKAILKKIMTESRKSKFCPSCQEVNGTVKKISGHALKIVHEKYRWYNSSTAKNKLVPASKEDFDASFAEAKKTNVDIDKHVKKAVDDLHPLRVLRLFEKITAADCELVGMGRDGSRPEMLIWQYVPAPPVVIRPSVLQDGASTEDDITNKLGDIVQISNIVRAGIEKGQPIATIMEQWEYLQIQVALYVNSDTPNLQQAGFGKPIRGFCPRLKGKQGRFRGNLSGKRVDFSGRTVISPDPNLGIDEVAVPKRVARTLTYPEKVTPRNYPQLLAAIANGPFEWPGANSIDKTNGQKINLIPMAKSGNLHRSASLLKIGETVNRHLIDGDIVLFNRQPSLHKLSILAHRVKVRNWRTFRLNECVCTPYNADFDGDEMNMHVPQTEEARVEATELMGVKHNLATPKDGTPIIAATQDFITAAYLLSSKDRFYDRKAFCQIVSYMFDGDAVKDATDGVISLRDIDIPPPVIYKPERLWTGKQVFNVLMRPSRSTNIQVNFDANCKQFSKDGSELYNRENDDYMCVRNSEVLSGVMDKNILGSGKKDSVFYVLMRDYGPDAAVQAMNRLAKLAARWLSNEGFSIGINDVFPGKELVKKNQQLITAAYKDADNIIQLFKSGRLGRDPGCDEELTMENRISGLLSKVRERAGALCLEHLSIWNSPVVMAKSGSKGSNINVAQMVATVGQQVINSARVEDGFQDRTLPHFPKAARQPPSKGFVANSFFSGLSPTEFIFHAMSGREGLVDTAVKTAETGYMSRRLMKSLEDLSGQYDETVRNASLGIVQFAFGEDGLDPLDMEGSKGKPVNFDRTFLHAQVSSWSMKDPCLLPDEIRRYSSGFLAQHREGCERISLSGEKLAYDDESDMAIDRYESKRRYITSLEDFVESKARAVEKARDYFQIKQETKKPGRGRRTANTAPSTTQIVDAHVDGVAKLSQRTLDEFLTMCMRKYTKAKVEPGHAVGAVGAQSIGEPGTQMTLKTFHFAGVAGMSLTQGVPRIKEIINGSRVISTPVISCELNNPFSERAARAAKARIEKTYLRDILQFTEQIWLPEMRVLRVVIDLDAVEELELDLTIEDVRRALISAKGLKLDEYQVKVKTHSTLAIHPELMDAKSSKSRARAYSKSSSEEEHPYFRMQRLKRQLPRVHIKGHPEATRAIISKKEPKEKRFKYNPEEENKLLVEGNGFKACLNTPGINPSNTTTNNIAEVFEVLGIEAARSTIIAELKAVMGDSMDIDPRHMQLLADVMTFRGLVLGITRFGLAKMRDSVLQLASFEKTPDHLFDAAVRAQEDRIEGVSECIIMGQNVSIGTGSMRVTRPLGLMQDDIAVLPTAFETACSA